MPEDYSAIASETQTHPRKLRMAIGTVACFLSGSTAYIAFHAGPLTQFEVGVGTGLATIVMLAATGIPSAKRN